MSLDPDHTSPRLDAADGAAPSCGVGNGLRRMFDDVVTSPMPQSLIELCDALEETFRRGGLRGDRKTSA